MSTVNQHLSRPKVFEYTCNTPSESRLTCHPSPLTIAGVKSGKPPPTRDRMMVLAAMALLAN